MNFAQPLWIVAGLIACPALTFFLRTMQKKRWALLKKFAARQLLDRLTGNVSFSKRKYKNTLILFAVLFCFVALARPQYGYKWVDIKRKGIDILFALDTSKSMLAEDIRPNRLKRARLAILDFVKQLDGDRVGLLPFAGSSYLMCPLTLDYDAFAQSLFAVSTDIIPRGGTNISSVINNALETLDNNANFKILIILTDGEDLQGDALQTATEAAGKGLTIFTVGVGTSEGELIPLPGKGFVKDQDGNFVTSKLDKSTLTQIAAKSGGIYVPLGAAGEGLDLIYQKKLALIPKKELAERRQKVPLERFEWPLAPAIILLCLELLTGDRKTKRKSPVPLIKKISARFKIGGIAGLLLILCTIPIKTQASPGEDAFKHGDYLQASEYYNKLLSEKPDDPVLNYNFGTSSYKNNMFDDAIEAFSKALKSKDIDLQEKAYYNRGNSLFRKGQETVQTNPQLTIEKWQQAIKDMDAVLALAPKDEDANVNRKIIKKHLARLQKQQKKNEKKKENKDGKKKDSPPQKSKKDNGDHSPQNGNNNNTNGENRPARQQTKQEKSRQPTPGDVKDNGEKQKAATYSQKRENEQKEVKRDIQRQKQGKMTREEAKRLLDTLKNEEGKLNFVPSAVNNRTNNVKRDW